MLCIQSITIINNHVFNDTQYVSKLSFKHSQTYFEIIEIYIV